METLLSVIVPAYNGEKTLKRAVDSLIKQTLPCLEILIIDDGSKDNTAKIADEYAASDPRVTVIHKAVNEGLSAGRNTGIAAARGTYITFLDCDDWVEPDMYEVMLRDHQDADMIVTGAYHDAWSAEGMVSVSTQDSIGQSAVLDQPQEILLWATKLDERRLFAYTWNKLYRKDFLSACCVSFENQTLIEDYIFNCAVWGKIKKLKLVDGCYYHYIKWSNEALTQRFLPDYFQIMDKRYVSMRTLLENGNLFTGAPRATACNMHIKHVIAGMVKNCGSNASMSSRLQRAAIRDRLRDANCREAISYAKGERKQEVICNLVFATGNVSINHLFARLLSAMQNSRGNLFDKLK